MKQTFWKAIAALNVFIPVFIMSVLMYIRAIGLILGLVITAAYLLFLVAALRITQAN